MFADPEGAAFRVWQAGTPHRRRGGQRARQLELERPRAPRDLDGRAALLRRGLRLGVRRRRLRRRPARSMVRVPGLRRLPRVDRPGRARPPRGGRRAAAASPTRSPGSNRSRPTAAPRWDVTFTVADADATAARAARLGGTVLVEPFDVPWQRIAVIRDPHGATFTSASSSRRRERRGRGRRRAAGGRAGSARTGRAERAAAAARRATGEVPQLARGRRARRAVDARRRRVAGGRTGGTAGGRTWLPGARGRGGTADCMRAHVPQRSRSPC